MTGQNMETNTKYTMFENYHIAAKEFANGDMSIYGRLMYILNCYGIENIVLDDLSPVEKLFFTSIRCSIDKSLEVYENAKKGGAPKGNKNATKNNPETTIKTTQNNPLNNPKTTPYNYHTNEEEVEEEIEIEEEGEEEKEVVFTSLPESTENTSVSPEYSKQVFDIFKEAGLPCCNKNEITFLQRDFAEGIGYLHRNVPGLHSNEVLEACRNYVLVTKQNNAWFTGRYNFEKFAKLKNFKDFLPDNFRLENFLKDGEKAELPKERPKSNYIALPKTCDCGALLSDHNKLTNKRFFCTKCRNEFEWTADKWQKVPG